MAEWDEVRKRLDGYDQYLSSYPPGLVGEDIRAALAKIDELEQIASGNSVLSHIEPEHPEDEPAHRRSAYLDSGRR